MTSIPLHRARASLTWIIERCAVHPVTITRHGTPVAVIVSPSEVTEGADITSDVRAMVRADLMHALALLRGEFRPANAEADSELGRERSR